MSGRNIVSRKFAMNIYLVRHTSVEYDLSVCYGQTDVNLADSYMEEFEKVKNKLPDLENFTAYSSPLKRCTMLAEHIFKGDIKKDNRLMELNLGSWELEPWEYIQENLFLNWNGEYHLTTPPEGESYQELFDRAAQFYDEISTSNSNDIVIVSHMGVIRAIIAHILHMPVKKAFSLKLDYGGVSMIEILPVKTHLKFFNL